MTARHFPRPHGAPLHLTDSPAAAPVLSPSDIRIAQLERDKKSLQARCAMLLLFANNHAKPSPIATIRGEARLDSTLRTAAMIESHGGVPCVRWARDAAGVITGIELAVLDGVAGGARPSGEMACVDDHPGDHMPLSLVRALEAQL